MTKSKLNLADLRAIVGDNGVLCNETLSSRTGDLWSGTTLKAKALVRPRTTEEVSAVLALCNNTSQRIVPIGGMSGLVEGQKSNLDEIVLSLERMTAIENLDPSGRTITVQGGAILQTVQQRAEQAGLMFPLDLGARASCTIGGNIATNAGGIRVIRYGMMRSLVLGIEVVLADGTILNNMNSLIKNNTGYDLKQLFIGSEGTLGIVTRAVLRLHETLPGIGTAFLSVPSWEGVMKLLRFLDRNVSGGLIAYEVMWRDYFELNTGETSDIKSPFADPVDFFVIVEIPLQSSQQDNSLLEDLLGQALEQGLIKDAILPKSETERQRLWGIRENFEPEKRRYKYTNGFDVSLNIEKMNDYVEDVRISLKNSLPNAALHTMGHIGDNNIHFSLCGLTKDEMQQAYPIIYGPLKELGGSISAEHGIGLEKKDYLSYSRTPEEIEVMRRIKKLFDPNNILNPGKIFDMNTST